MNKAILFITILAIFSISCSTNNFKTDDFSIFIPKNMQSTEEILDTAELQYYDLKENLYVAVEKFDIKEFVQIDTLCQNYIYSLFNQIDELDTSFSIDKSIKSKNIIIKESGLNDSFNWRIRVLETENNYFIIWTWSGNDNFSTNKNKMKHIVNSFKLK